jgi:hypothetical protein
MFVNNFLMQVKADCKWNGVFGGPEGHSSRPDAETAGVEDGFLLKVADFGLSRSLVEKSYYSSQDKNIPFKWCS